MINKNTICFLLTLLAVMALSGCTVGPDYSRPETIADQPRDYINNIAYSTDANDLASVGRWWENFADPVTNDLVIMALRNNTDLKVAAAKVVEAQAVLAQSHGIRLPQISYSAGRTRAKTSFNAIGGGTNFMSTTYSQDVSISYIVDFFGKLKRAEKASLADMLAVKASRQALEHSIIAQVIIGRVQIATRQRLLRIAREDTKSRQDTFSIIERRYNNGLVGPLDMHIANENLASSKALEPQIEQSVILAQHSLDVLTGRRPATTSLLPETLPELPELGPVPLGIPASLLDRRPDIRAAELALAATTERIGVSIAEMYPDLTLTASGGFSSDTFSKISAHEGEVYSAIIGLAMPIFTGGRLKAGVEAAKARTEQAAANYAGTILIALREVEDSLVAEQKLSRRLVQLEKRLSGAWRAEKLARQRYLQGVERILIVLETERRRRIAENELVLAKGNLWNARINLFLALGGDWNIVGERNTGAEK